MGVLPITHKAKNSPLKEADSFLVNNDAQTNRQFIDVRKTYAEGRAEGKAQTKAKKPQREEETTPKTKVPPPDEKSAATATSTSTPPPVPTK